MIEGLSKEYWDRLGDVFMGKDIGKDVKVGICGFVDMLDIGVAGIDRDVDIFGIFGDVGDVGMGIFDEGLNITG